MTDAELLALEKKLHDYLLDECFPYVVEMECGKCEKACETVAQAIRKESEK